MTDLLTYVCNKMSPEDAWTVGFRYGINAFAYYGDNIPADYSEKNNSFRKKAQIKAFKTGFAMGLASQRQARDWARNNGELQ